MFFSSLILKFWTDKSPLFRSKKRNQDRDLWRHHLGGRNRSTPCSPRANEFSSVERPRRSSYLWNCRGQPGDGCWTLLNYFSNWSCPRPTLVEIAFFFREGNCLFQANLADCLVPKHVQRTSELHCSDWKLPGGKVNHPESSRVLELFVTWAAFWRHIIWLV